MKKSLLMMLGGMLLFGGISLGAPNVGKSFANIVPPRVQYTWYGSRKLPSPTFLFTGAVPPGATTLKIVWQGETQSGVFTIKMEDWSEFSLHFRRGYDNM
jgi:hypothetical protein